MIVIIVNLMQLLDFSMGNFNQFYQVQMLQKVAKSKNMDLDKVKSKLEKMKKKKMDKAKTRRQGVMLDGFDSEEDEKLSARGTNRALMNKKTRFNLAKTENKESPDLDRTNTPTISLIRPNGREKDISEPRKMNLKKKALHTKRIDVDDESQ